MPCGEGTSDRGSGLSQTSAEAGLETMKRPESSGQRRQGERRWLMHPMRSFTVDMVQCGPFSARALRSSAGRSHAVISLGPITVFSRISCISGVWSSAGIKVRSLSLQLPERNFCTGLLISAGGGGIVATPVEAIAGPLRAVSPSGSLSLGSRATSRACNSSGIHPIRRIGGCHTHFH